MISCHCRECGCGAGDSGCAICGCCRSCAGEPEFDLPPPREDEEEEVLDQEDPLDDFYYMGEREYQLDWR